MSNLLVEIGTEELPTDALNVIYGNLSVKTGEILQKNRLGFGAVKVEATPRRIALYVENLAARQQDENLELSGPSVEKAYHADGSPTPALQGFLKSKDAKLADIELKDTPRGKFIVLRKTSKGKPAASVLPAVLIEIFGSLTFPKNMRWEKSGFRFPRPIRWLVALLDKKVISFPFANLKAGSTSYGHRFLSPKPFKIVSADWALYKKALAKAHVVLEREDRKAVIARALETKFGQKKYDEELLLTTAQLVEEPAILDGGFKKEYLELPKEVLASCMKKNQKIFACYGPDGRLNGKFAAVMNGSRPALALPRLREDYESVLESRLKDARYFYKEDTKEPLEKKLHLLEQVTYLGKLGNMKQKTERIEKLSGEFAKLAGQENLKNDLERAARLSKIDLMTHLVYEFPDIQGIAGREYSKKSGEKPDVASAIGTQYLPKSLSENYSDLKKEMGILGALLGIVDRLDHLVGAFGVGLKPTGSQDPYALRRAGGSIIKIIRAFKINFSMPQAIEKSIALYEGKLADIKELDLSLMKFFEERVFAEFQVKPGSREHEILTAVLKTNLRELANAFECYEKLAALYKGNPKTLIQAAKVVERTGNIIKGAKVTGEINPAALQDETEKRLYQIFSEKSQEIKGSVEKKDYERATARYGELFYPALHDFFEKVMVNVEDASIRQNRQALMRHINRLYTERVADLSLLSRLDQG